MSKEYNFDIPSDRIQHALEALVEFEKRDNCEVNMWTFHGFYDATCFACLGGAAALDRYNDSGEDVMSVTCLSDKVEVSYDEVFDYENSLDNARIGYIYHMFHLMGLDVDKGRAFDRNITDYHEDRDGFFSDMGQLVVDLREASW